MAKKGQKFMKYDNDFREKVVLDYLNSSLGYHKIAEKYFSDKTGGYNGGGDAKGSSFGGVEPPILQSQVEVCRISKKNKEMCLLWQVEEEAFTKPMVI